MGRLSAGVCHAASRLLDHQDSCSLVPRGEREDPVPVQPAGGNVAEIQSCRPGPPQAADQKEDPGEFPEILVPGRSDFVRKPCGDQASDQLILIAVFSALIILLVIAFYKEFLVLTFDPTLAATLRIPLRAFEYLQLVLIALAIAVSFQAVGVALMVAMLVTPAAAAFLLTKRLPVMMILAAVIASMSGVIGLYLSYYVNVASGPAIVLVTTLFFLIAWSYAAIKKRLILRKNGRVGETEASVS